MPLEIGLWRVDGPPKRMATAPMPLESRLEELIEADPAILGEPLLFVGRQVPTTHGKYIDLLAVDAGGGLHVLELKRDRTPRDVVAPGVGLRLLGRVPHPRGGAWHLRELPAG